MHPELHFTNLKGQKCTKAPVLWGQKCAKGHLFGEDTMFCGTQPALLKVLFSVNFTILLMLVLKAIKMLRFVKVLYKNNLLCRFALSFV
ncbi:MAG: hypothetical protein Q8O46_03705 [bacterium]|nr:hypothetical protein [bacterium]